MPTRWETYPIKLEGGLITNLGRLEQGIQAPGSATVLQNFEPDIQGGYSKILGYQKFSNTAVTGTGQIHGVIALSDTEALAVRDGEFLYSTGSTWTSKLSLTNPTISRITSETYNFDGTKYTVVVDGVNDPAYFNHTAKTMAYVSSPPSDVSAAEKVVEFKNHLFFVKGNKLSFTAPYAHQDFSIANGGGVIRVEEDIKGAIVFRDQLIVFCLNSIHRITGNSVSDFALSSIAKDTGCLCGYTIQEIGGDIIYLGPDGLRYLSASERENDFGLTRASEAIQRDVLNITNTNCRYATVTISGKNQYRIFTSTTNVPASNSLGFLGVKFSEQSAANIQWAKIKGVKVYDISKFRDRDREYFLFVSDDDYVYSMEVGASFDGENIEAIYETPYMPITDPKIRKTIYRHTLYARPTGTLSLQALLKFDYAQTRSSKPGAFTITSDAGGAVYGSPTAIYGTSVYGSTTQEQYYNHTTGSGFVVAIRYTDNSTNPSFNINFIVLEFRQNERR